MRVWTRRRVEDLQSARAAEGAPKANKARSTWWGQRWLDALEQLLGGDAACLARGQAYARAGRTHDLVIRDGVVKARVSGSRPTPYRIKIQLNQLSDEVWAQAILRMSEQAQFAAGLLAGEMPKDIDEAFRETEASLFPQHRAEILTECSCPDWGDPCKHVAAIHHVLSEALDRDPFLLFEMRGRTQAQVMAALRAARHGEVVASDRPVPQGGPTTVEIGIPTVALGKLDPAEYDRPRAALPALHLSFDEPATHGVVLRQLGIPTAWRAEISPDEMLLPRIRAAAELARRLALAEPEPELPTEGDSGEVDTQSKLRRRRESKPLPEIAKSGKKATPKR